MTAAQNAILTISHVTLWYHLQGVGDGIFVCFTSLDGNSISSCLRAASTEVSNVP